MSEKIKVLIIDDSAVIRNLVSKMLSSHPDIEIAGTALNGKFGLSKLETLKPHVIILDLEMPEMNGIEFLKEKKRRGIATPVIVLSAAAKKGTKITLEALQLGASDFVLKPSESNTNLESTKNHLIELVLGFKLPSLAISSSSETKETDVFPKNNPSKIDLYTDNIEIEEYLKPINRIPDIHIVSIGISTGGPNALREILPLFPANFPAPIVIVQHMPAGFTSEFAIGLNKICNLEVKEAANNDLVVPGRILIAQGGKHLKFEKKAMATVIQIEDGPPVSGHKPSVDVLFESTVMTYGGNSLGCIMTGMGRDGAENIGMILKNGGITIGQDQKSSVVYGMPHIALKLGHLQLVRPLNKIAQAIIDIVVNKTIRD